MVLCMLNIGESNELNDKTIACINFGQCMFHPGVFSIFYMEPLLYSFLDVLKRLLAVNNKC